MLVADAFIVLGMGAVLVQALLASWYQVSRDLRAEQRYGMDFPETGEIP